MPDAFNNVRGTHFLTSGWSLNIKTNKVGQSLYIKVQTKLHLHTGYVRYVRYEYHSSSFILDLYYLPESSSSLSAFLAGVPFPTTLVPLAGVAFFTALGGGACSFKKNYNNNKKHLIPHFTFYFLAIKYLRQRLCTSSSSSLLSSSLDSSSTSLGGGGAFFFWAACLFAAFKRNPGMQKLLLPMFLKPNNNGALQVAKHRFR